MALLERMSVMGIRSFSHETPQKMEFFTPVTLILGQNGTGKTTIIECLKYSTTGDLPPGSKVGCSFVHDPRIALETEVKAKVTLQMRDVKGCPTVISRALAATQKDRTKHGTLKTLDGSLKRQLPGGEIQSSSLRSSDLDHEMVTSLGVSKAVLENVIFCHQEESNWPLQEAKMVKQRFDDLFASSRYVKALDAIRKCKQDNDGNIKLYKTELKHLTKNRDDSSKIRSEREETLVAVEKQEGILETINSKLRPILENLYCYKEKYAELTNLQSEIKASQTEHEHLRERIKNLAKNVSNEFIGTDTELNFMVENADAEFAKKELHLKQLEDELQQKRNELVVCQSDITKMMVEHAHTEMEVKRLKEAVASRNKLITSAIECHGILAGYPHSAQDTFNNADINKIEAQMSEFLCHNEEKLKAIKASKAQDEQLAQSALDSARDELATVNQKINMAKHTLNENAAEISTIKKRLESSASNTYLMDNIRNELLKLNLSLNEMNKNHDLNKLREDCNQLTAEKREIESSIINLDEKISSYHQNAHQHHELDTILKDRANKLDSVRKIRRRHSDVLEQLFSSSSIPLVATENLLQEKITKQKSASFYSDSSRLKACFNLRLLELERSTRESRKSLARIEQERSSLETSSKFTRNQLQAKKQRHSQLHERLLSVAGTENLENALNKLQSRRSTLEEETANGQGSLFLWRKFRDRLGRDDDDADCPLCHRCFNNHTERIELLAELDQRITTMPTEFERKKQELTEIIVKYDALIELKPINEELKQLIDTEIPELDSQQKLELEKLNELRSLRDEKSSLLETCQADESLAKSIEGDLAILERLENESFDLTLKLKDHNFDSSSNKLLTISNTIETLTLEKKSLQDTRSKLSAQIDGKQKRFEELDQSQRRTISEVHRLKDNLHKLEEENQENVHLKADLTRLLQASTNLEGEIEKLESDELPVVHLRWTDANNERSSIVKKYENEIDAFTEKSNQLKELITNITEACSIVNSATNSRCEERLKQIENGIQELKEDNLVRLKSQTEALHSNLDLLKKEISEHKIHQRELADCVQLRQLRTQLKLIIDRTDKLTKDLSECNSVAGHGLDLIKETKRLSAEEESLRSKKQDISNQLSELKAKLQYLDRDLNEKYANADSDYCDMMYQLKTTELASTDLERYYKALDRAIMSYHSVKMAEVNKIVRELWRTTYRGNDIDYIEICSEDDASAVSNASRARRTYNYRVIMVKTTSGNSVNLMNRPRSYAPRAGISDNEVRLDMRGRCSAGQKVLASLLIRLALAEVFCLHCGVLALDEPTTNLDRENIESLAYSLVEIIKNRKRQKNFQLIVITHDEDFVELLGRSDYVEHFFLLSRDSRGLSEIRKVPISEHFQ